MFLVAAWMTFDCDDCNEPDCLDLLMAADDALEAAGGIEGIVKPIIKRHSAVDQTHTLNYNNGRLFLHLSRSTKRETDYVSLISAFVEEVEATGLLVIGAMSKHTPDDASDAFQVTAIGRARLEI
jgi:hypothetical protein